MNNFLRDADVRVIVLRTSCRLAHSPILEYLHLQTHQPAPDLSRELSIVSDDSIDSLLTHSTQHAIAEDIAMLPASPTQSDISNIVFKLCCSLYKRALAKTHAHRDRRSDVVTVDAAHEKNMSCVMSWMPLLHLFDPKTFYALDWAIRVQSPTNTISASSTIPKHSASSTNTVGNDLHHNCCCSNIDNSDSHHVTNDSKNASGQALHADGVGGIPHCDNHKNIFHHAPLQIIADTPSEASRKLLDELDVEKLAGGNSNHVYHLNHPKYPDNSILLRVYGSGGNEAIDRYRDTMAMKQMSEAALSPAVLHTFKWGRVEEYMSDVVTCTTAMMLTSPRLLGRIYSCLYEMHQLPVQFFLPASVNKEKFRHLEHSEENEGKNEGSGSNIRNNSSSNNNNSSDEYRHVDLNDNDNNLHGLFLHNARTPEEYCIRNVDRIAAAIANDAAAAAGSAAEYYIDNTREKVLEDFCPSGFERTAFRFLRLASSYISFDYRRSFTSFICAEIIQLRDWLQCRQVPLVFAHNDLNPGNILLSKRMVPRRPSKTPHRSSPQAVGSSLPVSEEEEEDEVMSVLSDCTSSLHCTYLTRKGRHINLVDWKGLVFIDFEYSDVNYCCYDLGNTLNEMDYDYSDESAKSEAGFVKYLHRYPPAGYETRWAGEPMEYPRMPELIYDAWVLSRNRPMDSSASHNSNSTDDDVNKCACGSSPPHYGSHIYRCNNHSGDTSLNVDTDIDAHDVSRTPHTYTDDLSIGHSCLQALEIYFRGTEQAPLRPLTLAQLTEVYVGMLASHLTWFLWSIVMGCNPDTCTNNTNDDDSFARGSSGLDYIQYANCRWREYSYLKDWLEEKSLL